MSASEIKSYFEFILPLVRASGEVRECVHRMLSNFMKFLQF